MKVMRTISKYLSILAFFVVVLSSGCSKEIDEGGKFIGSWKIVSPDSDTLTFTNESTFTRKYFEVVVHTFSYSYDSDSITIQYTGPNKILVRPSTHHYELKKDALSIDFSNGCYGFDSTIYKLSRIK